MSSTHDAIARICDDVRGTCDSFDFKNFVFTALFFRYLCEIERHEFTSKDTLQNLLQEKEGIAERFISIVKKLNEIPLYESFFDDYLHADSRLGTDDASRDEVMYKLLHGVADMPLDYGCVDPFGDAFEYMMQMFANNGGRSGGEYYTPKEVSKLVSKLAMYGRDDSCIVYDPTCGTGSLLLQARENNPDVILYGQELNPVTYNLARMNMDVHGATSFIYKGDTLTKPHELNLKPDTVVANPPYSVKWAGKDNADIVNDPRFVGGIAPKGKADWAFLQHIIYNLADDGCAAVVVFPGILYRGNTEKKIRQWFIENNYIDTVIDLPENVFFGTQISTCIVVMKKNRADDAPVRFIDASDKCVKSGKKNILSDEDIDWILAAYSGEDTQYKTNSVSRADIAANDYTLSVSSYIEPEPDAPKRPLPVVMLDLAVTRRKMFVNWVDEYNFWIKDHIVSEYFVSDLMDVVFKGLEPEIVRRRAMDGYYDGLDSFGDISVMKSFKGRDDCD